MPHPPISVLFVGNSLIYVGNTPAVFDALAAANGVPAESDMIVKGGATLSERVEDGSIARALTDKSYSAIVLQERGGDLMCLFGPESCPASRKAIRSIVALARASGAKVYLLGTYQRNAEASAALVAAESAAAAEAGIPYVEVSRKLHSLSASMPEMKWQARDGVHPGPDLVLLNAVALHQALLGRIPRPRALTVTAPIYGTTSGLTEARRSAEQSPPLAITARKVEYSAASLRTIVTAVVRQSSS